MKATFNKSEKLKSKKEIEWLFSEGKSISQYPIRLIYRKTDFNDTAVIKATVSVGKRNFKKAVDRNRIKRLLREVYRKNKHLAHCSISQKFACMFIYTGKEIPEYDFLDSKMIKILKKFASQEIETD